MECLWQEVERETDGGWCRKVLRLLLDPPPPPTHPGHHKSCTERTIRFRVP
jgi:hypothetical protein